MGNKNILITSLGHFLVHFSTMVLPSIILLLQSEFNVSMIQLGTLIMTQIFFMGIGGFPSGILVDRYGTKIILLIYFFGIFLSTLLLYFTESYSMMYFGMSLLGLAAGLYHPAGLKLVSFSKNISKQMALHGMFGSIGLACGPLYGSLFASIFSWRLAYLVIGLSSFLLFICTIFFINNDNNKTKRWPIISFQISDSHILIFLVASLWGVVHHGLFNFLPYYFSERVDLGYNIVIGGGSLTAFILFLGIAGQYIGGQLGENYDRKNLQFWLVTLNIPFLIIMGFLYMIPLVLVVSVLGAINFMFQPVNNSLIADITNEENRGFIYGILFGLSFGVGSLSGYIGGVITELYQISYIFPTLSILLIPASILAYMLRN